DVAAGHGVLDGKRVGDVAGHDFDAPRQVLRDVLEESPVPPRVIADQRPHPRPAPRQLLGQVAADEPARAGDQDPRAFPRHAGIITVLRPAGATTAPTAAPARRSWGRRGTSGASWPRKARPRSGRRAT